MVARSTDSIDATGEGQVRTLGNATSNLKGKPIKRLSITRGHFPKLTECAHFHYEAVDFGHIQLQFAPDQNENLNSLEEGSLLFPVQVTCQGKSWQVHRSYEEFRTLDAHLHCCIFDRRFSQLPELPPLSHVQAHPELLVPMLSQYLEKLSAIVDSNINCSPVLTWMELDNHGNRLLVNEEASINVPAIAAAHVVKRYTAQACDELSFEVGDIISVIDMPPKEDRSWWRGKHGFQVGFFPSECVELFSERPSPGVKPDAEGTSCVLPTTHGLLSPTSDRKVTVSPRLPTEKEDKETGLPKLRSLRRPHSSSDAFPTLKQCHSCSSLGSSVSGHGEGLATGTDDVASRRRSSWLEGDSELDSELELSPPGLRGLDFDPLTYQCSPPVPQPSLSDDSSSGSPVAALSPCSHPNVSQDASETLSVSLPDKVLEMFSGGESRGLSSPPHMISMLLSTAGGQLSNTCEREVHGKIYQAQDRLSPPSPKSEAAPVSPGALSLLRHIPPPPPPKNPARLMALALAESAHQAALQQKRQASLKQREPRTHFRRSLSLECKAGELTSGAQALYSMVRPSPKAPGLSPLQAQARGRSIGSQSRNLKAGSQVPLSQSSPLGSSDSFSPFRRVLAELDQRDPPFSDPYHLSSLSPAYGLHPPPPPLSAPYPAFRQPQDAFPSSSPSAAPPKPPPPPHFPIMTGHLPLKTRSSTFQPCLTDHPLRPHSHFPVSSRPGVNGSPPSQLEHENLYYEIVGEPPAYPGLARPWPSCPPPEYLATFNASYGVFERPWRQAHLPPAASSSLQPILKNSQLQIQSMPPAVTRQEPIYVNVPFPEPSFVSPTPSPPPEAAHPRSHSDPGAPQALPQPSRPPLPQKQKLAWGYTPSGQHRQLMDVLPCSRAVWQFYRPPSACWGHPSYGPEPIITYDGPAPRSGSQASAPLQKLDESSPQYGNVERREGPPSGCYLGPSWTVYAEGQTHSYC
ncbi:rho GTPase-activating protein 33-like [Notechis scutatus]|uniref:Rho GTPase-activating protein 33-like n=1 Tax=Notechis scutatus TaxID=8663 RepID=A0A6J1UW66_9SAUR|nr:rho GTPase-activating protein 33-like [Notechis scutatus]